MVGGVESLVRFVERLSDEPGLWPRLLADPLGTAVAEGVAVDARDVKGLLGIAGATDHELMEVLGTYLQRLDPIVAGSLLDGCVQYLFPDGLPLEQHRPPSRSLTGLPLGARPDAGLTATQLTALGTLERFDLSPIETYLARESALPATWLAEAVFEFRRYLGLRRVFSCSFPMFSDQVDEVWHTCLLFTELYAALCRKVFGYFTHHDPWDEPKPERVPALWQRFSTAYHEVYGPPGYLWTIRLTADAAAGWRAHALATPARGLGASDG
jgi:hypothetical protein